MALVALLAASRPLPAQADSASFGAVADATVMSDSPSTNFGADDGVRSDRSPAAVGLLRFRVEGLPGDRDVTRAILRLYVRNGSSNGPKVWRAPSESWAEDSVTWATRPAPEGPDPVADLGSVSAGSFVEVSVASTVTGDGVFSFVLVPDSSDGTVISSREAASNAPQLVIDTASTELPPPPVQSDVFDFGAIGDTGYDSAQVARIADLRRDMNAAGLAFTVHDGDIKSGGSSCSNSVYLANRDRFDAWEHPFIYTPGDNEWSDCSNQLDRLDYLRGLFFPDDHSLGHPSMELERQSGYPENARWHRESVTFVTLHTVGYDNNVGHPGEFGPRDDANIAWMKQAFDEAEARGSLGVVLVTQANPRFPDGKTGFRDLISALKREVAAWGKPVLYIHGDTHTFRIDQPLSDGSGTLRNFTRLETYATKDPNWVRVGVVPDDPALFRFTTERY